MPARTVLSRSDAIPAETLTRKLGAILEIYEMFVGDDPRHVPMRIFPGVHYSMGGLWVDFEQRTNIPGLFAAGECDYSIHGANRLGANSLVSRVYGGFTAAPSAIEYAKNVERGNTETNGIYDAELKRQAGINEQIISNEGGENQYKLHDEMGKIMTDNVTVVRYRPPQSNDEKLIELQNVSQKYRKRFEPGRPRLCACNTLEHEAMPRQRSVPNARVTRGSLNPTFPTAR